MAPAVSAARPEYWNRARRALKAADSTLAGIIREHPRVAPVSRGDAFNTLARAIVGQQISVKAADAVWGRFCTTCGELTPRAVLRRRATTLRACGLSDRKVEYIRDLADHFACGRVDPVRFHAQDDEQIIAELTDIRGIGRWTAEMFLIFNLLRPNVLPLDDLGLLRAVSIHYFDGEPVDGREGRARVAELGRTWEPWRSVATWYLWRSLDPVPVEY
jgi:DNA-3-methyladenine glycosylase II